MSTIVTGRSSLGSLSFYLFGSPRLESNGHPVHMDTRKALALLAYLVVSSHSHTRDTLATLLWPDYDQTNARAAFRRTLSTLKKALGTGILNTDRELVEMAEPADLGVDVLRFRSLLAESQAHEHGLREVCQDCLTLLGEAVELYQGDFMAGFTLRDSPPFDDWQFFESESLRQELGGALQKLALGLANQAEYVRALAYARRWLAMDPLREEAHRLLMQLFEWSGQRGAALRQYRECVRVLDQELGVPPLEETTLVYQAILENNLPKPVQPIALESKPAVENTSSIHVRQIFSYPLVGRQREWQSLLEAYQNAHKDGSLCLIEGETGIGKSRLALEFLDHMRQTGASIFQTRCYEGESDLAYGPFIGGFSTVLNQVQHAEKLRQLPEHWMSVASRLIPEISTVSGLQPPSTSLEGPGAQVRFFEGLRQVLIMLLAGPSPGILFVDDLHWADVATMDFLTYLTRRLKGTHMLILITMREDALSTVPQLSQLYGEIVRMGNKHHIQLDRLTLDDLRELIYTSIDHYKDISKDFAERLYQESEGLPLIAVEYLGGIAQQDREAMEIPWRIPGTVRDVFRARLGGMDETAEQLLSTAAVIGRYFDFNTLREVSGRSEAETINGLETLLERALIREEREGETAVEIIYDFIHEKLRALVYDETSLARRRLLHRRIAEVLSTPTRGRRETDASASLIARHYKLAGQETQAAEYFKLAGEHARSLHAHIDAVAHLQAALASGYPHPAELHEAIGDMRTLTGEYAAAITSYETAAALSALEDLPHLEHKLGNVHHRLGNWELAECHFQVTLDEIGEGEEHALRSRTYADWSRTAHYRGQAEQALSLAHIALQLAQEINDVPARAQACNTLGMLWRARGNHAQAIEYLDQSLADAETLDDPRARIDALNNLALAHFDAGDTERAITLTQRALELCAQQGDRHREAALLNNLADLLHASGDTEEAMTSLKRSMTLFSEIGVDAGNIKAEIWKLVEW